MYFKNLSYKSITILLALFYFILYIPLLINVPTIMMDEPWYANTAFNFAQGNGFVNTNVGYRGGDVFIGYTFLMGIFFKVLGCSLWTARFVSLLGGLAALFGLISIFKRLNLKPIISLLCAFLFIISNISFVIFRSVRPEGLTLTFGIWAIYFLLLFLENQSNKNAILLGLFSSFSFLIYPNGILFLMNTGLIVLFLAFKNRQYRPILIYTITCFITIIIPFAIVFSDPKNATEFLFQAQNRNAISNSGGFISNISEFFSTYTLGIKRFFILTFELGILLTGIFFRKENILRIFAFLGILNFLVSMAIFNPYVNRNFGEISLFSIICFALIINYFQNNPKYFKIILGVGLIYMLNSLAGDFYIISKKSKEISYKSISDTLLKYTGSDVNNKIVTVIHFWFPFKNNEFYCKQTNFKYKKYKGWVDLFARGNIDYIITSNLILRGSTGTSGRSESVSPEDLEYYNLILKYGETRGVLIKEIDGGIYGTIKVWKMKKGELK